jgi:hypothetical protein
VITRFNCYSRTLKWAVAEYIATNVQILDDAARRPSRLQEVSRPAKFHTADTSKSHGREPTYQVAQLEVGLLERGGVVLADGRVEVPRAQPRVAREVVVHRFYCPDVVVDAGRPRGRPFPAHDADARQTQPRGAEEKFGPVLAQIFFRGGQGHELRVDAQQQPLPDTDRGQYEQENNKRNIREIQEKCKQSTSRLQAEYKRNTSGLQAELCHSKIGPYQQKRLETAD